MFSGGRRSSILYDGGLTPHGLASNLDIMQVDPAELRAIVVSHGHVDHHGGLEGLEVVEERGPATAGSPTR